jgi:hypothetical protein
MRIALFFGILCLICAFGAAKPATQPSRQAPASQPTSNATNGTITGIVLDSAGNPANDCIVVAQQAAQKMRLPLDTATNEKGEFTFENLPEGEYNLKIRTRDGKSKATKTVEAIGGESVNAGKLKLRSK